REAEGSPHRRWLEHAALSSRSRLHALVRCCSEGHGGATCYSGSGYPREDGCVACLSLPRRGRVERSAMARIFEQDSELGHQPPPAALRHATPPWGGGIKRHRRCSSSA